VALAVPAPPALDRLLDCIEKITCLMIEIQTSFGDDLPETRDEAHPGFIVYAVVQQRHLSSFLIFELQVCLWMAIQEGCGVSFG
jgi:hypothetical protein